MATVSARKPRRSLRLLAWATVPVTVIAVAVQISGTGLDILIVAIACLLLLALERTLGDWLGELLGSGPAAIVFILCIAGGVWYFVGDAGGRSQTDNFFAGAQRRGYSTVYYSPPAAADIGDTPDGQRSSGGAATNDASTPAAASGSGSSGSGPARLATRPGDAAELESAPVPARTSSGVSARDRALGLLGRKEPEPQVETVLSLRVSPGRVSRARRASLTATVNAGGRPVTEGFVQFTVNGVGAGRRPLDAAGTATVYYSSHIAGSHEVRARFLGAGPFASSSETATLTVR